ncbi:hypothetical protein DEU37_0372 [Microbacterium sp. AG790]|nr:hypothetical protein DEU37_0372 [Microbacterium sp. AG790]
MSHPTENPLTLCFAEALTTRESAAVTLATTFDARASSEPLDEPEHAVHNTNAAADATTATHARLKKWSRSFTSPRAGRCFSRVRNHIRREKPPQRVFLVLNVVSRGRATRGDAARQAAGSSQEEAATRPSKKLSMMFAMSPSGVEKVATMICLDAGTVYQ